MNCRHWLGIWVTFTIAGFASAQDHSVDGTRQLYYLATPPADTLPPINRTTGPPAAAPKAAALHLGLLYNVVLVDKNNRAEQIPSNRVLRAGECFAIDLQANRSSYLYVLVRQSSGSWMPILPSSDAPDQRNELDLHKRIRVPTGGECFTIHNPPGAETFFVVLSRDPKDFYELYAGIKSKESKPKGNEISSETQAASSKVDAAVEHLDEKFGSTRDISVTRVDGPSRNDEPEGAVYVVNKSDKPAASLVTKIEVKHK